MNFANPITPLEWTDDLVSSIWEYYSTRPEAFFTYQFGDQILAETLRFVPQNAVVCDYGCGTGFLLKRLVARCKAAGIDYTPANLQKTAEVIGENDNLIGLYHISDADGLKGTFDAIYFVETIEHLLDAHIAPTMQRLRELLKPGGVIICTTPHDEDLSEQEVCCPITRKTFHRYQHVRSFSKESIQQLFEENGFEPVATFGTEFSAKTLKQRIKARLREYLGKKNPHLVCVAKCP